VFPFTFHLQTYVIFIICTNKIVFMLSINKKIFTRCAMHGLRPAFHPITCICARLSCYASSCLRCWCVRSVCSPSLHVCHVYNGSKRSFASLWIDGARPVLLQASSSHPVPVFRAHPEATILSRIFFEKFFAKILRLLCNDSLPFLCCCLL